ncbi:hypothetical protein J2848_000355 [Azospirillum lipoferum]|uniref:Phage tail protein n=1 Tax=Azospirillum lipoferum TaxID=193 RepID=A0A5A9GRY1_AZOLI|nr:MULTISPECIES: hypothetical protein [Azospirillum]KAA0597208.1 hypothetical protein FZ942_08940 [Azospirillum lipoferum]MCP1608719.1 hypothetical protein [Azospirillum lipoferum]MDW5535963.1 hypothetical protein [Azospirillum sp. NL1]
MALLDDGQLARTIAGALAGVMGPLTLSRTVRGSYDPSTGTVGPGTTTTWTVKGMLEDFGVGSLQRSQAWLDGSIVREGDRKATLLAFGMATVPAPGDVLTAGGRDHTVLSVTSDPAGATFELLVR